MSATDIQAVLFDLDNTLLDRRGSLQRFVRWQASDMLRPRVQDEHEFLHRFLELDADGLVWKDVVYRTLVHEYAIDGYSAEELLASYEHCFRDFVCWLPGAQAAVRDLHQAGYKLGLVTNGKSPFQQRNFRALGAKALFNCVLVSDAVGLSEPDPAIFRLACDALALPPQSVVFVGDDPLNDIHGARGAGMRTVQLLRDIDCAAK